jgi:hypothetical protein
LFSTAADGSEVPMPQKRRAVSLLPWPALTAQKA